MDQIDHANDLALSIAMSNATSREDWEARQCRRR